MGRQVRLALVALAVGGGAACGQLPAPLGGDPVVVDGDPPPTPYPGPLRVEVTDRESPDPLADAGGAGRALECDGPGLQGQAAVRGSDLMSGLLDGEADPEDALEQFVAESRHGVFPEHGFRVERADPDRVLFSLDVAGRTKAALVVVDDRDPATRPEGWVAESMAWCDASELPAEHDEAAGLEIWTDTSGRRVNTGLVQSYRGAEHCDWTSVTFLDLGDEQFLSDPEGLFPDVVQPGYAADVALPAGARDLGFHRDGVALWRAGDAVYAVSDDETQRWPKRPGPTACA